ncbi:armadillo-type protein [Gigaspora rosea]|uniref:Armadillo-type protein n=1 Tax=Gigaspora rosea TaxID=44941 RepID=A0A397UNW5_9GLOM|nr:armadillo-type protein [Gigaspora rosea]
MLARERHERYTRRTETEKEVRQKARLNRRIDFLSFEWNKSKQKVLALKSKIDKMENELNERYISLLYDSLAIVRYLIKHRDLMLWAHVLDQNNMYRRSLTDQINAVALPESIDPEDVSVTVKAFMAADLPIELMELLAKFILDNTAFSDNRTLQNLLILTAIKADKSKVMNYINKPNNFDAPDVAEIAVKNGLYEEAFNIYKKHGENTNAINVLIEHIGSIDRASEFAEKSYIRADDPSNFNEVIVGDRCYDDGLYAAAKILFQNISNWTRLSSALVHLEEYQAVVDGAHEILSLLEVGLGLERAHMGNGILYENYGEFDNGSLAMMNRASDAWEHSRFKDIIVKVSNVEIYYKALKFYMDEHLLVSLTPRIYHTRVVQMFHKADNLPLIKSYLISVQGTNNEAVNEAYNNILIEDYKSLRDSFDSFDKNTSFLSFGALQPIYIKKNK